VSRYGGVILQTGIVHTGRLAEIIQRFHESSPVDALVRAIDEKLAATMTGLAGSADAFAVAALAQKTNAPILVVAGHADEAHDLYEDLAFLLSLSKVGLYPSRQILPYDFRAPVGEIMGQRLSTLSRLVDGELQVVVTSIRALLEPTITVEALRESRVSLTVGEEAEMDDLTARLVRLGFRRVPLVEEVGDFARRGGLIDLFTADSEYPVRIEFFGDQVESIRLFDVANQRTIGRRDSVQIVPKRELPITQETLEQYLDKLSVDDADYIRHKYLNDPELPGLEWLSVLFGVPQGSLVDFLPAHLVTVYRNRVKLAEETQIIIAEAHTLRARLADKLTVLPTPEQYYHSLDRLSATLDVHTAIDIVPFRGGREDIIDFGCQPHPALGSRLDLLGKTLKEYQATEVAHLIATDSEGQASRLTELIREKIGEDSGLSIEVANLSGGFVFPSAKVALLTDHEIFSRYHRRVRKKRFREGVAISDYAALNQGDYVVHADYGIARYLGLKTIIVDHRSRDCLLLQYAESDRLYVPIEEFNRVAKYAGKDTAPELTRLGGAQWDRLRERTEKAIADMAEELLVLYAQRKTHEGESFGEDTVFMKQLEASFPYDETTDQEKAINDVKRDLGSQRPMDRLICGDVGYGKTEVAVRAAFKVVDAGKQVAVLVPTTILAQQHFATFTERMRDFPVRIAVMSRFRTRLEQEETAVALVEGKVDIVIGTHRLLSQDIVFKDLGLLVIDEEHRFGVKHKERLRQLKASVDTLVMTATPIPRTLQMSLVGVRDMSLITTSPKDRLPIITEIVEFDPAIIATAILREVDRGGQVFFVHNRVQTIEAMHKYLNKILPQVEIGVAHGQMHERTLEGVMLAFMAKRFNVLLCTSIIESGLDIPSANTIIINRADRFGLAQLYQLRGRVGRSARRAYAYLLTPTSRVLTADAVKRLRALEAHSDLGAGFALAMRDLEIRGAGTILGARQSGFIEEIGFDLYNKLLEEAIAKLKGEEIRRVPDTRLELDLETHLAEQYVNDNQHKVDIYRRLADSRTLDEVERIREEVTDRFGRPPQSAVYLFDATAVKIAASLLDLEKLTLKAGKATLYFAMHRKLTRPEVEALRGGTNEPMEFLLQGQPRIVMDLSRIPESDQLPHIRGVLSKV
jgi:transcription-repair coupling factor (superfamily II helicase)